MYRFETHQLLATTRIHEKTSQFKILDNPYSFSHHSAIRTHGVEFKILLKLGMEYSASTTGELEHHFCCNSPGKMQPNQSAAQSSCKRLTASHDNKFVAFNIKKRLVVLRLSGHCLKDWYVTPSSELCCNDWFLGGKGIMNLFNWLLKRFLALDQSYGVDQPSDSCPADIHHPMMPILHLMDSKDLQNTLDSLAYESGNIRVGQTASRTIQNSSRTLS